MLATIACDALALASCDEPRQTPAPWSDSVSSSAPKNSNWIGALDKSDPAIWLVAKETGRDVSVRNPGVEAMRSALALAGDRFLESDRMLANRTVHLSAMLASDGHRESYLSLLTELSDVVIDTSAGKQTYGDLCQFYLNLRRAGVEREQALASLKERVNLKRLQ